MSTAHPPDSFAHADLPDDGAGKPNATGSVAATEGVEPWDTPGQWLDRRFPGLTSKYGEPLRIAANQLGQQRVIDINEDFLAATLGDEGKPTAPVVFAENEGQFYGYVDDPAAADAGVYAKVSPETLVARISSELRNCSRECETPVNCDGMAFGLGHSRRLIGVISKARAHHKVTPEFFKTDHTQFLPCANGVLELPGRKLHPFRPAFAFRNKLGVPYQPGATCPLFLELLRSALDQDDADYLLRWMGLALAGENKAQVITVLTGTSGGGKGVIARVITGVLGTHNVASLRTQHLGSRFELGGFIGRTLLYGPDVGANFLNESSAPVLKSLTGGDPVTMELKGTNARFSATCRFNVLVTSNSALKVHLQGDTEAWRRRLHIIRFQNPATQNVVVDLSERILAREGAGVLNLILDGQDRLRSDGWQLKRTSVQAAVVDNLLLESDSVREFVCETCVMAPGTEAPLTVTQAFSAYVAFCASRGWSTVDRNRFGSVIEDKVTAHLHVLCRHDVPGSNGSPQRGWKGVRLR